MSYSLLLQSDPVDTYRTVGVLLTNTTGDTGYTGTAPGAGEVKLKKATGAEFDHSGTWTHIANGYWEYVFTAAEINTAGKISMRITHADLYGDVYEWQVVPWDPNSATNLGLSYIDTTMSSRLPTSTYEPVETWLDAADAVETGLTLRNALRLVAAYAAGNVTGGGSGTELFTAAVATGQTRFTSTPTSAGSRTVVVDLT